MEITINDVYKIRTPKDDVVRVLAVLDTKKIVVISLEKKDTLPYEIPLSDFEDDIAEQNDGISLNEQYPPSFVANPTTSQIEAAKRTWKVIGAFVQDEPSCYDHKIRSRFITAKSRDTGIQRKQIQRWLYRYWAGGKSMYALYPRYERRAQPGRPRVSDKPLGRPAEYDRDIVPIQIGTIEESYIQEAVNKYYNCPLSVHLQSYTDDLMKSCMPECSSQLRSFADPRFGDN